jgi:hypothetical protein
MDNKYSIWINCAAGIAIILYVLYLLADYELEKYRKKYITDKEQQDQIKEDVTRINITLLDMGMTHGNIEDFWQECFSEAQIRHQLPPCSCKDVNECETWCQAMARFTLNPPIE